MNLSVWSTVFRCFSKKRNISVNPPDILCQRYWGFEEAFLHEISLFNVGFLLFLPPWLTGNDSPRILMWPWHWLSGAKNRGRQNFDDFDVPTTWGCNQVLWQSGSGLFEYKKVWNKDYLEDLQKKQVGSQLFSHMGWDDLLVWWKETIREEISTFCLTQLLFSGQPYVKGSWIVPVPMFVREPESWTCFFLCRLPSIMPVTNVEN